MRMDRTATNKKRKFEGNKIIKRAIVLSSALLRLVLLARDQRNMKTVGRTHHAPPSNKPGKQPTGISSWYIEEATP